MRWLFLIALLASVSIADGQFNRAPIHDPPWLKGPSLLDKLVSHWRLDEASGMRFDSFATNHLVDIATVAQVAGKITNAIDFQGGSLFLAPGPWIDPSNHIGKTFTFSGWVQLDALTGEQCLISQYNAAGYVIQTFQTNLVFYVDGTGALDSIAATNVLATGTWYFFVTWLDDIAGTINIQIDNGTVISKSHTDGINIPNQNFTMGNQSSAIRPMNGRLDSVSYWRRVLNAQERSQMYNFGNGLDFPFH